VNVERILLSNESLIARARIAVVSTIGILIAALIVWRVQTGFSTGDAVLIAILTVPLLIALPRLLAGHRRTYAWMTLAVTPFLIVAITEAVASPGGRIWAALCLIAAFVLFVLLIAYLRLSRGQA
jgi:uncharacterized membrane protein